MKVIRGSLALLAAALIVVIALAASASASTRTVKHPPCTKRALAAGLRRGRARVADARIQRPFRCVRGWAYSNILVGGRSGFDAIAVFRARHRVWVTVNRAKPCRTHQIPRRIYRAACTTS